MQSERAVAVRACEAAAELSTDAFRDGRLAGEFSATDAKTGLDTACEERIVSTLQEAFPDDAVRSEERSEQRAMDQVRNDPASDATAIPGSEPQADAGDSNKRRACDEQVGSEPRREWIVDPLDGTNNVACGLPVFAHAVCLRDEDGPVLAVVHEPLPDDTYVAERGAGASVNGEAIRTGTDLPLAAATVSLVPGHDAVQTHRAEFERVESTLGAACKRVVSTWAPCVDWGLLARGQTEAIVTIAPDVWEQAAGSLLAREAEASVQTGNPLSVFAADEATRDALVDLL